jgi:hypothetical protein
MPETITITTPPGGPDKPPEQTQTQQPQGGGDRPAWLPENFAKPEDLVASYKELQAKHTKDAQAPKLPAAESVQETELFSPDEQTAMYEEYSKDGKFSEETVSKLKAKGVSTKLAESVARGWQAEVSLRDRAVYDAAGGEAELKAAQEWALGNWKPEQIAAYNRIMEGGDTDTMVFATKALVSEARGGKAPTLLTGSGQTQGVSPFRSFQQMMEAQGDPRYGKDPAFMADFDARLALGKKLNLF